MSGREVRLERLVGRRVRDAGGRSIGRIEELICGIELHEHGRDYVVREFRVGTFGRLDALSGSTLVRELLKTLGRVSGYRERRVGWQLMDLGDPVHPRLRGD
ncbi:MAG: hypothetical protein HOQ30_10765 [Gemmatimonadaceae bacterium]|nr:hypothetical protein [Gemmatimonadaceae bacterium]